MLSLHGKTPPEVGAPPPAKALPSLSTLSGTSSDNTGALPSPDTGSSFQDVLTLLPQLLTLQFPPGKCLAQVDKRPLGKNHDVYAKQKRNLLPDRSLESYLLGARHCAELLNTFTPGGKHHMHFANKETKAHRVLATCRRITKLLSGEF